MTRPAAPPPEMPELLPCPFCDHAARMIKDPIYGEQILCGNKDTSWCAGLNIRVHPARWNHRTLQPYTERERVLAEAVRRLSAEIKAAKPTYKFYHSIDRAIALAAEIVETK